MFLQRSNGTCLGTIFSVFCYATVWSRCFCSAFEKALFWLAIVMQRLSAAAPTYQR
jgi:hypothetical protein